MTDLNVNQNNLQTRDFYKKDLQEQAASQISRKFECVHETNEIGIPSPSSIRAGYRRLRTELINAQAILNTPSKGLQKYANFFSKSAEGACYEGRAVGNGTLPLGFFLPEKGIQEYWGSYVPNWEGSGKDTNPNGPPQSKDLQIERVMVHGGTPIYDGGMWQIALSAAGRAGVKGSTSQSLYDIANNENKLLEIGCYGDDPSSPRNNNRMDPTTFIYRGLGSREFLGRQDSHQLYFRMVGIAYAQNDPLALANGGGKDQVNWSDWRPVTGDHVWGLVLGPLQAALIQAEAPENPGNPIDFSDACVQNAIKALPALMAMQTPCGALLYAPENTYDANPKQISIENNVSALAALTTMRKIFEDLAKKDANPQITDALNHITLLLNGGTYKGAKGNLLSYTDGILKFLLEKAIQPDGRICASGSADFENNVFKPDTSVDAVDCYTWFIAAIGVDAIDQGIKTTDADGNPIAISGKGPGFAARAFQNMLKWGGFYGADGRLRGVGYSDRDGNQSPQSPQSPQSSRPGKIISGEWTAGAITAARSLLKYYQSNPGGDTALLQDQIVSMLEGLNSLRVSKILDGTSVLIKDGAIDPEIVDLYKRAGFDSNSDAVLYANTRFYIPFGWYANPIPNTAATAWAVCLDQNYNPMNPDGEYGSNNYLVESSSEKI